MKTVRFTCHGNRAPAYSCDTPGDNSGNYVDAATVAELVGALQEAIDWDSHDITGVPAVWLERAENALAAVHAEDTGQGAGEGEG